MFGRNAKRFLAVIIATVMLVCLIPLTSGTAGAAGPYDPGTCEVYDSGMVLLPDPYNTSVYSMSFSNALDLALYLDGCTILLLDDIAVIGAEVSIEGTSVIIDTDGYDLTIEEGLRVTNYGFLKISGDFTGPVYAYDDANVEITGDLFGFISAWGVVTFAVGGDVVAEGRGVYAGRDSTVDVLGNIIAGGEGVWSHGNVAVAGNVLAIENGVTAMETGTVTVGGEILAAGDYIVLRGRAYDYGDRADDASKPGFYIFTDGSVRVWVSDVSPAAPVIVAQPKPIPPGLTGDPYVWKLFALNMPIDWSLSGEPGWLSINSGGVLNGTPDSPGVYTFSVTAENTFGVSASETYSLTVTDSTPFNINDLSKLKAFAQQGSNMSELGWNQSDPLNWDYVIWEEVNYEYRLVDFDVYNEGLALTGDLDLSDCTKLRYLDFDNNNSGDLRLTSLNLSGCVALECFYCNGNMITSIDITGCTRLDRMYCNNNLLTALPDPLPGGLTRLYCDNNQLTAMPVLPSGLRELYCQQNRLSALDVTGLSYLSSINCSYNYMASEASVTGFTGVWDNSNYIFSPQHTPGFKAVTNIIGFPQTSVTGVPLTLTGIVLPADATNSDIVWDLDSWAGSTKPLLNGNVLTAYRAGWVSLTATVIDGYADGQDKVVDFYIIVTGPANNPGVTPYDTPAKSPDATDDTEETDDGGAQNPFTDVAEDAWYYDDVMYVFEKGLMIGTSADSFSPEMTLSRAMVVTVLYRLAGEPDVDGMYADFADVVQGSWYENAVAWAAKNGIIMGYGGGFFGPNDPVTRQDLAVMLLRYSVLMEISLPVPRQVVLFSDEDSIADYAKDAVQTLHKVGVINGVGEDAAGLTIVDPRGETTRAQAAAMLHRFLKLI